MSEPPPTRAEQLLDGLAAELGAPDTATLAALRTMLTQSETADTVRAAMTERQRQAARHLAPDDADLRAGLIGAVTIGVVISRHLLGLEAFRDAPPNGSSNSCARAVHEIAHGTPDDGLQRRE